MTVLLAKLGRDIRRQWPQFTAVAVIAMLGVALFGSSNDAYLNLKASYASLFTSLRFADLQVTGGDTSSFATTAESDPAVESVQRRHVVDAAFDVNGDHRLIGRLVGLPVGGQPSVDRVMTLKGGYLSASDPSGVLAEQHFANHFNLVPGSHLQVLAPSGWRDLTILGVVASAEYIWPARSRQETLTSPDDFGVLFVPDAMVTEVGGPIASEQVLVYLDHTKATSPALDRLEHAAVLSSATDVTDRTTQPSNAALSEDIDGFGEMAFLFPILFLGAASLTVYVLLTRLVRTQRAVIGTLLACGVRRGHLLFHYVEFGLVVGLVAGVVGAGLGLVLARLVTSAYTSAIDVPVTVVAMHPETAVAGIAMAVVITALAALAPAIAAFHTAPAEAMRGDAPIGHGNRTLLERAVPALSSLPASQLMVLRGVSRSRRRAVTTAIGVVLAATLILVSWGMLDSTQATLGRQFQDVERQDATAYANDGVTASLVDDVANIPGVAAAERFAEVPVTLRHSGNAYETAVRAFEPGTQMHRFRAANGHAVDLPSTGVLIGSALAGKLGVQVGDLLEMHLTSPGQSISETVRGYTDDAFGSFAYMSLPELEAQSRAAAPNAILLRYSAGADHTFVTRSIDEMPGIAAVVETRTTVAAFGQLLGLFYAIVGAMLLFGFAMAFGLIFATVSVNVLERRQEFATMLTSGVRLRQIAGMVTAENTTLTVAGLVPGLVAGYWGTAAFLSSFNSDLFHFDTYVSPRSYLITVAAIVLAAFASEVPALRGIARIDLAAAAREHAA